jgi:hypothetical protein
MTDPLNEVRRRVMSAADSAGINPDEIGKAVAAELSQCFEDGLLSKPPEFSPGQVTVHLRPEVRGLDISFKLSGDDNQ